MHSLKTDKELDDVTLLYQRSAVSSLNEMTISTAGVNQFQNEHQLGNTGVVAGVIGPQTAGVYFQAIMDKAEPAGQSSSGVRQINEAGLLLIEKFDGLAKQLSNGMITAYRDSVRVPTIGIWP